MFNSLDEQIERDESKASTIQERWLKVAGTLLISVVVFGVLYAGMVLFE